jgi:hypothetical protein
MRRIVTAAAVLVVAIVIGCADGGRAFTPTTYRRADPEPNPRDALMVKAVTMTPNQNNVIVEVVTEDGNKRWYTTVSTSLHQFNFELGKVNYIEHRSGFLVSVSH